eukprot:m.198083 g.198083  ORF g.198083 m.198083 type:complete len:134 (-) comp15289_c0_seq2:4691-5092(-)
MRVGYSVFGSGTNPTPFETRSCEWEFFNFDARPQVALINCRPDTRRASKVLMGNGNTPFWVFVLGGALLIAVTVHLRDDSKIEATASVHNSDVARVTNETDPLPLEEEWLYTQGLAACSAEVRPLPNHIRLKF